VEGRTPSAVKIRLYREARPLFEQLSQAPAAPIAHYLIDTLQFFVDVDPEPIFRLVANAIRAAAVTGYATESVGVKLFVKVVERYLADHRDVFAGEQARRDLLDCLDAFVRAGWPAARSLTYRIADIWQ
jgi:hypothetical protein